MYAIGAVDPDFGGWPSINVPRHVFGLPFRQQTQFNVRACRRPFYGFDRHDDPKTERSAGLQKPVEGTTPHRLIGQYRLALLGHVFEREAKRMHHVRRYAFIQLAQLAGHLGDFFQKLGLRHVNAIGAHHAFVRQLCVCHAAMGERAKLGARPRNQNSRPDAREVPNASPGESNRVALGQGIDLFGQVRIGALRKIGL